MKHTRYLSLLLAALLALMPLLPALAEDDYPEDDITVVIDPDEEEYVLSEEDFIEIASEPYIPDDVEKTIFGADNRTVITNRNVFPYRAIAYLVVDKACGCKGYTGTGFMVADNCLMTAAHMVMCSKHNKPLTKITMYFGYQSDKNYYYKYETSSPTFWYDPAFFTGTGGVKPDHDYAYIKVPSSVGDVTGHFGLSARSDIELNTQYFELAGYRDGVLRKSTGYANVHPSRSYLTYTMDTEPGNSGCPLFDSSYYVLGINVASDDTQNYACRITRDIINEMYGHGFFK